MHTQVLEKADELRAAHKDNEKRIAFIENVLQQLFFDRFKFRGINVKHRIAEVRLQPLLLLLLLLLLVLFSY